MVQQASSRTVVNLTRITPNSDLSAIDRNFRAIQVELAGLNDYLLPKAEAGKEAKDRLDRALGNLPPISRDETIERLEEARKEIEEAEARLEDARERLAQAEIDLADAKQAIENTRGELDARTKYLEDVDRSLQNQIIEAGNLVEQTQRNLDDAASRLNRRIDEVELDNEISYYPNALPFQFSRASDAYVEF